MEEAAAVGAVLGIIAAYLVAGLYTARWVYGQVRARNIDARFNYYHQTDAVEQFDTHDRGMYALFSVLVGTAWPIVWTGVLPYIGLLKLSKWVIEFLDRTDWRSGVELEMERQVQKFEDIAVEAAEQEK